jgi:four helix bundle protein
VRILHFRDLVVWQKAMSLMIESYAVARCFPVAERFVLSEQLRRASLSVPANIAEG